MIKYGVPPADWIRKLGKRMLKFDFKGYSRRREAEVGRRSARATRTGRRSSRRSAEIGYDGWATAEVGGGGEDMLKKISAQMDKVLGL